MSFTERFVYGAGPITACTVGEANDWRRYVADQLEPHNITLVSPLRCEPLVGERYSLNYPDPKFGTPRAIANKNLFDVRNADMVLANIPMPEPGRIHSLGTLAELSWAHAFNKPAILVSNCPFVMAHPVVDIQCGWKLESLDDAIEVIIGVLGAYTGGKNV